MVTGEFVYALQLFSSILANSGFQNIHLYVSYVGELHTLLVFAEIKENNIETLHVEYGMLETLKITTFPQYI